MLNWFKKQTMQEKKWKKLRKENTPIIWDSVKNKKDKIKYDRLLAKSESKNIYGDLWEICWEVHPEIYISCEKGAVFLFGEPNKIIDIFLIERVDDGKIFLTHPFATVLWRDWKYVPKDQTTVIKKNHSEITKIIREQIKLMFSENEK